MAAMSWFHLTLMSDTPIVVDLKAAATSPEERLRKLGERVGLAVTRKSEQYFAMADAASQILLAIEARQFANPLGVRALYAETTPANPIRARHDDDHRAMVDRLRPRHEGRPAVSEDPAHVMSAPPVRARIEAPKTSRSCRLRCERRWTEPRGQVDSYRNGVAGEWRRATSACDGGTRLSGDGDDSRRFGAPLDGPRRAC